MNTYAWNAAGELSTVNSTAGVYTYNYTHQRTKKVAGGNTVHYVYGLNGLLYGEYDNSGNLIREYVYLNDEPLAQINAGAPETLTYLHTDHLGTPIYGTNSGGSQVWAANADAFGVGTPSGAATVNLRMAGQYYDAESSLHYNWNRYYNPSIGRYISSDPIGLEGGLNTFNYANVSPLMYYDKKGLLISCRQYDIKCEIAKKILIERMRQSEGGAGTSKHRARNVFNRCPAQPPTKSRCMPKKQQDSSYRDNEGAEWNYDLGTIWGYHCSNKGYITFRNAADGSQCTYKPAGNKWELEDEDPLCMGTYDYHPPRGVFDIWQHNLSDVLPHDKDPNYIPNITTRY